jgi:hypothetical protein|tara:strand:- start:523 stop:1458 length:936 start_codon:yes stop_codon:yes gene_type:complete
MNSELQVVPNWSLEPNPVTEPETVTEPTIKNLGGDWDPFMEVHKEAVYFNDKTQNPTVYGIRLGTQDKVLAGNVSADYLLVSNRDLVDICVNQVLDQSSIPFEHHKRFFNNKGQFRDIYYADGSIEARVPEVGDIIRLVAEIQNSYNGTTRAGIRFYFERLDCLNGMTSNVFGFGHTFRHSLGNINWEEQILQATKLLRTQSEYKIQQFAQACGKLQKPIDNPDITLIREKYLNKLPVQQFGQLMDKYLADKDYTAWGLLNAGTNVLWHANKLTNANFSNNTMVVDGMLEYGKDTYEQSFVDPNQTELPLS